jgi:hypothetical protein
MECRVDSPIFATEQVANKNCASVLDICLVKGFTCLAAGLTSNWHVRSAISERRSHALKTKCSGMC